MWVRYGNIDDGIEAWLRSRLGTTTNCTMMKYNYHFVIQFINLLEIWKMFYICVYNGCVCGLFLTTERKQKQEKQTKTTQIVICKILPQKCMSLITWLKWSGWLLLNKRCKWYIIYWLQISNDFNNKLRWILMWFVGNGIYNWLLGNKTICICIEIHQVTNSDSV